MNRKKARHLVMEMSRRLYLKEHGDLKGFGKIAKFYNDDWRHTDYNLTGGYKKAWNSPAMTTLREILGMKGETDGRSDKQTTA